MPTHNHAQSEVNRNDKSGIYNFNLKFARSLLGRKEMFTLITKAHTYSHYIAFSSRHCTELDQAPGQSSVDSSSVMHMLTLCLPVTWGLLITIMRISMCVERDCLYLGGWNHDRAVRRSTVWMQGCFRQIVRITALNWSWKSLHITENEVLKHWH